MEYTLFQCIECKQMVAYPSNRSDGHRCKHCNGMLKPINKGTREELDGRYIADIDFSGKRKRSNNSNNVIGMELSRLSKQCRECRYVDTCDHKRMEALAGLPLGILNHDVKIAEPTINITINTSNLDIDKLVENIQKTLKRNCNYV